MGKGKSKKAAARAAIAIENRISNNQNKAIKKTETDLGKPLPKKK